MVTQLDDKQLKWLVDVAGVKPVESLGAIVFPEATPVDGKTVFDQREELAAKEKKKGDRLKAVREKLEEGKSKIRALMEIEVTLKDGTQIKAFSGSELWNPDEEFDAVHHTHQTTDESLSTAEMERLNVGCQELAKLRDKLTGSVRPSDWPQIYEQCVTQQRLTQVVADEWLVAPETIEKVVEQYAALLQKTNAAPGDQGFDALLREQKPVREEDPLFSDLEIRKELFDPLVREKIIPDNEVEDRFNQSYQHFSGASEEYKNALREFSDTAEEDPELTQLRDRTNLQIKNVTKIGGELIGIIGKLSDAQEVSDIADLASTILEITEKVGLLAVSSIDQFYGKQVEGLVDQVGAALELALKAALGDDAADYAKWIRAGYSSIVSGKEIAELLMKREKGWVDNALEKLAGGVENALSIGNNEHATLIGKVLKNALLVKVNRTKICDYLNQDPPAVELILATIGKAATAAFKDIAGSPLVSGSTSGGTNSEGSDSDSTSSKSPTEEELEKTKAKKKEEEEFNKILDEFSEPVDGGFGEIIKTSEEVRKPFEELQKELASPEKLKELTSLLEKNSAERLAEQIESELKAGPASKSPEEDDDIEKEFVAIQPLIAEMKKSGIYLKMADTLLDSGLKAVGEFVAVVKVAASGKDMIKNMLVAYGKKRQLYQWKVLREDALAAASIVSSSFAAKIKDLEFEFSESRYKLLLSVADTLGTSLSSIIDPSGTAGVVLSKSASASGALLEIVLAGRKASDLAQGWQAYRDALRNPGDRIKVRAAIQKNSTLAKYALAYAALHDDDSIAKTGLAKIGLTEEVLRDPSAKIKDVVEYLEAVWANDPSNMKKIYRPGDWQTDVSGDLTLAAWMSNMNAARSDKLGDDKVIKGTSGGIEGALTAVENAESAFVLSEQEANLSAETFSPLKIKADAAIRNYKTALAMCDGIKTELLQIQKKAKEVNNELTLKKKEESWKDPTLRSEILKSHLESFVQVHPEIELADILERIKDYNLSADDCLQSVTPFPVQIGEHIAVLEKLPLVQQEVIETLAALGKSLPSFKPKRSDDAPSRSVMLYVRSVLEKTESELNEQENKSSLHKQETANLQSQRREAESLPNEIQSKRKQVDELKKQTELFQKQYREHIVAHNKEWEEAKKLASK